MGTVLIVVYLLIVLAMIVVILLQRSEGGGLGMGGGGGGGGGLVSARGSANLLTRTTAILGTLFMVTAIGLTIVSQLDDSSSAILDQAVEGEGGQSTVLDALDSLSGDGEDADLALPPEEQGAAGQGGGEGADLALPETQPADGDAQNAAPEETAPADETPVEEDSTLQSPIENSPAQEGGVNLALPETGEETPPTTPN